jgi:hypothetical protein
VGDLGYWLIQDFTLFGFHFQHWMPII